MTMSDERMVFWTRNDLKLPKRISPVNFAVQRNHGFTSNAWGVQVKKTGDAYIYCRDHMKDQRVSLHASGKQHITFDESASEIKDMEGRFMNQWWEPQHNGKAIPTFRLLFPAWGLSLNSKQRDKSKSKWDKNHVLIKGDDNLVTVVSFVILDDGMTLRKEEGSLPSAPIGILRLRPGKKRLCVIAGYEPEGNLRTEVDRALRASVSEELIGDDLSVCLTGYSTTNSAFMLFLSICYVPDEVVISTCSS